MAKELKLKLVQIGKEILTEEFFLDILEKYIGPTNEEILKELKENIRLKDFNSSIKR